MKATHTPGRWTAVETFDFFKTKRDRVEFADLLKTKRERMDIVSQTEEKLHCVAIDVLPSDARLISCAPQMLLALERLTHPMADDEDLDHAREVIKKARGV